MKEKQKITFFETLTTIAFLFFQMQETTVNVFEVGLGGRLDATNVTEPELSIITRIGYDHTHLLGKTLGKIAKEKCGVLRRNRQAVVSYQRKTSLNTIKKRIEETGAKGVYYEKDYDATLLEETVNGLKIHYNGINTDFDVQIPMLGTHQIYNVSTALAALELLYPNQDIDRTQKTLKKIVIPARIQVIQDNPCIILDMSHNVESAESLRSVLEKNFSNKKKKVLLIGITKEKAKNAILKTLSPFFSEIFVTQANLPRAESREVLYKICQRFHNECLMTQSVETGINHIVREMRTHDLLVITGSVYVAGEAIKALQMRKRSNI
jgi:dihydrofolate synthase/folylpolyglutamate synthase